MSNNKERRGGSAWSWIIAAILLVLIPVCSGLTGVGAVLLLDSGGFRVSSEPVASDITGNQAVQAVQEDEQSMDNPDEDGDDASMSKAIPAFQEESEELAEDSAQEPEVAEQTPAEDASAEDPPAVAEESPSAQSTPVPEGYQALNPPYIPMGEAVNTENPIPLPPGLPDDFESMSLDQMTMAMEEMMDLPLVPVEGEEGVAWVWNGKGLTTATIVCPEWLDCHVTLVSGNATVLFRGHGEQVEIWAGTFRVERLIPGRGGLCDNVWGATVYEASDLNYIDFLGEADQCPYPPPSWLERINTDLGRRRIQVQDLTGVESVIPIGTVKEGFGAFVITQTGVEPLNFTCWEGAACAVDTGDGWQWVEGQANISGAVRALLYDLDEFTSECEAFTGAQGALGDIADGPSCQ